MTAMYRMIFSLIAAFTVTFILTPILIPFLKRLKFGQSILEIGPSWHKSKEGTPTMGGMAFIIGILFACACFMRSLRAWVVLLTALCFGLIGFIDDFMKVVKKKNQGLRAGPKALLQLIVAIAYLFALKGLGMLSTEVWIPFFNVSPDFGFWYYPFAAFAIVGTVNAVNLTDGIDGLVSSVTLPVGLFFAVIAAASGDHSTGVFAAALIGGLIGFLVFNANPAKVFMGDTGSLFLGGAVTALAFCFNMPVIILIVGFIYVVEALSDVLQVGYFKLTHGKRIFKMCPIHHHFEMCGWSEKKIVAVFSSVSCVMCAIAVLAVLLKTR